MDVGEVPRVCPTRPLPAANCPPRRFAQGSPKHVAGAQPRGPTRLLASLSNRFAQTRSDAGPASRASCTKTDDHEPCDWKSCPRRSPRQSRSSAPAGPASAPANTAAGPHRRMRREGPSREYFARPADPHPAPRSALQDKLAPFFLGFRAAPWATATTISAAQEQPHPKPGPDPVGAPPRRTALIAAPARRRSAQLRKARRARRRSRS